jgi:hypothetical protein
MKKIIFFLFISFAFYYLILKNNNTSFNLTEWQKWHSMNNRVNLEGKRIIDNLEAFENELRHAKDPQYLKLTIDAAKYVFGEKRRKLKEMCNFDCLSGDCDDFAFAISKYTFHSNAPVYMFPMHGGNHAVCCGNIGDKRYLFSWWSELKEIGINNGLLVKEVAINELDSETICKSFNLQRNTKIQKIN